MAASEPRDLTASNKEDGLDEARAEALSAYVAWLEGRRLAESTVDFDLPAYVPFLATTRHEAVAQVI